MASASVNGLAGNRPLRWEIGELSRKTAVAVDLNGGTGQPDHRLAWGDAATVVKFVLSLPNPFGLSAA